MLFLYGEFSKFYDGDDDGFDILSDSSLPNIPTCPGVQDTSSSKVNRILGLLGIQISVSKPKI